MSRLPDATLSFCSGIVLTGTMFALLYTTKPVEEHWRRCAPAQTGEQLVSSTQWEDRTDCFYQRMDKIRRHSQPRKEAV